MIRNVVFDFGQVLVRFDPDTILSPYLPNPADRQAVIPILFDRLYWNAMDAGTLTEEGAFELIRQRLPESYLPAARRVLENWFCHLPPIDGMQQLVDRLKKEYNVRLFVLSNISATFAKNAFRFPVFSKMDGCVFSAVCGHVKPNADIFDHLCKTYRLIPAETIFIDDAPKNLAGAEAYGIHPYHFDGDVSRLEQFLSEQLAPISRDTK